jgi:two-component system aerobic respiration control sensor histidine kinase ArcB
MTLPYKILLVEDAKIAQEAGSAVLREIGCQVDIVKNGEEAVLQVARKNYDLIFMDLGLPDMDGFSVTEAIRQAEIAAHPERHPSDWSLPIIALTAHAGEHVEITCLDAKMDAFLVKPLTHEAARKIIETYLK